MTHWVWSVNEWTERMLFCSLYCVPSLQSEQHDELPPGSVQRNCWRKWNAETKRTTTLFYYLCVNKAWLRCERTGRGGINQKVSILLSMAARANKMIILINNRPNNMAGQRTRKDTRQKASIEWDTILDEMTSTSRQNEMKWELLSAAVWRDWPVGIKTPTMHIYHLLKWPRQIRIFKLNMHNN